MSVQPRRCRLAKFLQQAMNHLPDVTYCSDTTCSGPGPMLQGSRHELVCFTVSGPEPEPQDLPERTESPSTETLEDLLAKLEFENELNRVCDRLSLNVNTAPAQDITESADSRVEEGAAGGEEDEEDRRIIDMVLDMEQDYELFVYLT